MNDGPAPIAIAVLVVERYWPSVTAEAYLSSIEAANGDVGLLASILISQDDRVLSVVLDGGVDRVEADNRARGLPFIRVTPATVLLPGTTVTRPSRSMEVSKR